MVTKQITLLITDYLNDNYTTINDEHLIGGDVLELGSNTRISIGLLFKRLRKIFGANDPILYEAFGRFQRNQEMTKHLKFKVK
jgi:hypothetical protein